MTFVQNFFPKIVRVFGKKNLPNAYKTERKNIFFVVLYIFTIKEVLRGRRCGPKRGIERVTRTVKMVNILDSGSSPPLTVGQNEMATARSDAIS